LKTLTSQTGLSFKDTAQLSHTWHTDVNNESEGQGKAGHAG